MKAFDFELLETMDPEDRSELIREYLDELPIVASSGMIDVACNLLDLSGDATAIGQSLLETVHSGLESSISVHEIAEKLFLLVERLVDLSSQSQEAAEALVILVHDESFE
jgi:hypothetical protein